MKLPDYTKAYVTQEGFASLQDCFSDVYEKSDLEILRIFEPIARQIADGDFPKTDTANRKSRLADRFFRGMTGAIDVYIAMLDNLFNNINPHDERMTIFLSDMIAKKIAPTLSDKLAEMQSNNKLTFNVYKDTAEQEKDIKDLQETLNLIHALQDKYKKEGETDAAKQLGEVIGRYQKDIDKMRTEAEKKKNTFAPSSYIEEYDTVNLMQTYTTGDVFTLLHELTHAAVAKCKLTSEIAPILTEFEADDYMSSHYYMGRHYRKIDRVTHTKEISPILCAVTDLFENYEKAGELTHKNANTFMTETDDFIDGYKPKPENEYRFNDVSKFDNALIHCKYFIGTASALVIQKHIRNKEDLQRVFTLLNDKSLTELEKLKLLGINKESLEQTFCAYQKKHNAVITMKEAHLLKNNLYTV